MFFFFFNYKPYIAIIGDIIGSKQIKERNVVQKKLNDTLDIINKKFPEAIASKFMITLGDEFQGLLKAGSNTIEIIEYIERKMYPTQIRFGIGVGEITTTINPDIPIGADGPAYYNAREMINNLKEIKRRKKEIDTNIMIGTSNNNEVDILLNAIFGLCTFIKSKWTNRQREIIYDCMEHGDNQIKAAERLGITQSSVQKNLSNSGYYSYKKTMDTISNVLSEIKGDINV